MLDAQDKSQPCTACGSPLTLKAIEPSMWGEDSQTFACPRCNAVQRHIIESPVIEAWSPPKS
jgi:predicted RNA-binding Zn-ribbon protein involved in translation (DUF1610 family)